MLSIPSIFDQSADLDSLGEQLVERLVGTWERSRRQGLCLCPAHADRTPSLSVRVGNRSLLFHCFAGCTNLEVVRALRRIEPNALRRGRSAQAITAPADDARLAKRLHQLWDAGTCASSSPVEIYLGNRSIGLLSDALRYHPRTPLGPKRSVQFRPAMLAVVRQNSGIVALQRTFLDIERGRSARDIGNPRRMLGRPGRGCVRLAPAVDVLGLAEGIESALSAMTLLNLPVWATLGNERFSRIDIPLSVRRLVLLADNDRAGRLAVDAASIAHAATGRCIEAVWPWNGLNDWNDVLRSEGKGVGDRVRQKA
ncbi:virulence-associated protein E [Nostoc sp. 3335mG]|nr:virulence-associated protein E [Nostoc sp. 3335mG]